MSPEPAAGGWPRVVALLDAALACAPEDRARFLDARCSGDAALRAEVASLLAAHEEGGLLDDLEAHMPRFAATLSTSGTPDMVGREVGRYRIISRVAGGGMGVVYEATDARLGRTVALKFLHPRFEADGSAAERFRAEARTAAALDHPNVCAVYEIDETSDGQLYIVMPRYSGETLQQRIARGPLPTAEAVTIGIQIARGLGAAHARHIIHRDVKPSNVFVTDEGVVRVLDFGIAKLANVATTSAGGPFGTVAYMSPEQLRGDAVDPRADLWSLGVVLYEMLTGVRPFDGDTRAATAARIEQAELPPSDASRIPAELDAIVRRALARSPEERYPDAAAMEAGLTALLAAPDAVFPIGAWSSAGTVVGPRAVGTATPSAPSAPAARGAGPRRGGRRRLAAMSMLAVAVVAFAITIPLGARWRRNTPPTAPRALAVLPFTDMSGDSANRYFSDGLSEEITTTLGRIRGLHVAARSSAFALRDSRLDVRAIGDTLGVDAVLEGSVRRSGEQLRVTVQLVDARSGLQLWSNEYERKMTDVLTVQDEIARAIADALALRLPSGSGYAAVRRPTDPVAYDLYLRALALRSGLHPDGLRQAAQLLGRAIELQPDFALAWAARASVLAPLVFTRQLPQEQGLRDVRAAIDSAFALDSLSGEAHVSRGIVQLFWDHDWAGAERSLRLALALNPNDPHAWHHMANYWRAMNRPDDAATARLRGLALDPLDARLRYALADEYVTAGRLDEAREAFMKARALDPLYMGALGLGPSPPRGVWIVDHAEGHDGAAVEELLRVATLRGATPEQVDSLRHAFASGGLHLFWQRWLAFDRGQSGPTMDPLRIAGLAAMAGDTAQALGALERAYAEDNGGLIFMRSEPAFEALRASPRYLRIEQEMHFPVR